MKEPKMKTRDILVSRFMGFTGIVLMILSINTLSDWSLFLGVFLTVVGLVWFLKKNSEVKDIAYYKTMVDWKD